MNYEGGPILPVKPVGTPGFEGDLQLPTHTGDEAGVGQIVLPSILENRITGENRDHVTYRGIRNGKPYTGYTSAPSSLGLTEEEIIRRRYNNDFSKFGGVAPDSVYGGSGVKGKNTARGLEQNYFDEDVESFGRENVDNKQNPVGKNNKKRKDYKKAADEELNN